MAAAASTARSRRLSSALPTASSAPIARPRMNSGATVVPGQLRLDPGAEALDALARDLGPTASGTVMRSGNAGEPAIRCIDAPSRSTRKTAAEVTPGQALGLGDDLLADLERRHLVEHVGDRERGRRVVGQLARRAQVVGLVDLGVVARQAADRARRAPRASRSAGRPCRARHPPRRRSRRGSRRGPRRASAGRCRAAARGSARRRCAGAGGARRGRSGRRARGRVCPFRAGNIWNSLSLFVPDVRGQTVPVAHGCFRILPSRELCHLPAVVPVRQIANRGASNATRIREDRRQHPAGPQLVDRVHPERDRVPDHPADRLHHRQGRQDRHHQGPAGAEGRSSSARLRCRPVRREGRAPEPARRSSSRRSSSGSSSCSRSRRPSAP